VVRRIIAGLDRGLVALAHGGPGDYRDNFELVLRRESAHPNDLWQADHTELDVMVLDETGKPARPWLTVILDDHSRAVAGYTVFLGDPSAMQTAIVEGSFPAANDRLRAAVARAATPGEQVDAYVRNAIDLATDRTHRSLDALGTADLPAECRTRLAELHQEQYPTLHAAVSGLGITDPELITRLLVGIVHAAAQAIVQGASRRRVTSRTLALIHQGLDSEVGGPRQ
jgi:hypothetical protein